MAKNFIQKIPYRINYFLGTILLYKNPLQFFSAFFSKDNSKTVKLNFSNGLSFFARKNIWDLFVLNEIMVKKEYSIIEKETQNPKTIIDIGSHIGGFSVFYAKKFENAQIFCFEPMPKNFELLCKNISANGLQNQVHAFNFAVTGKKTKGKASLFLCEENPACNSLDKNYSVPGSKEITVELIAFSEIFSQNNIKECDLLKLDCENVELEIIKENQAEFKKIKSVILEYHDPKNLHQIQQLLADYGFETQLVPGTILLFAKRKE